MTHYDYLIIGGGMTATAAVSGIRQLDGKGRIGIITAEPEPPYNRPPLSKQLWTGRKTLDTIYHTLPSEVEVHVNCTAQQLDPAQKQVLDDHGHRFTYNKLLLATGSSPRRHNTSTGWLPSVKPSSDNSASARCRSSKSGNCG